MKTVNGLTKKVSGDQFDEWKRLAGHSFTAGFVVQSLRSNDEVYKKFHGDRPVKHITASDVSNGKGYLSEVLRCIIHFVDSTSESDIYTTILKIPGVESLRAINDVGDIKFPIEDEKFIKQLSNSHQTEVDFYDHLSETLDIPVPRVFKTLPWKIGEAEGVVHMEDMTGKGKQLDLSESLTIPQIKVLVKHLVHMHRTVLTSDNEEFHAWKGKHNDNQLFYVTLCETLGDPKGFLDICGNKDYFEPLVKKYHKFAINPGYVKYAFSQSWKDLNMSPVVVHGDFYTGNMMWKLDNKGEIVNEVAAFYDWQISHEGSPMADLARVITMCSDGWVRRQAEEFVFDFYHDQLKKEMNAIGKSCPYTLDQIKKAYNYIYLTQCYVLIAFPKFLDDKYKNECPGIRKAKVDRSIVKVKHALEDMDKLLSGEMKDIYEKYGQ